MAFCALGGAGGCLVDDDKCDENQRQIPGTNSCACIERHVPSAKGYGCDPCGDNQDAVSGECVCTTGYTRSSASSPCQPVVGSVRGSSCSATAPCVGENSYCATSESSPYCTTTCTTGSDCPVNWRCVASGSGKFCKTAPTGLGEACTGAADCAGKEASYCSSSARACLINNCVANPSECPSGSSCCDLTSVVGQSLCLANAALAEGKCPISGMPPVTQ